eukprot:TRINITY_DN33273_c0_g1_i8.p1 TRINITY_DN33273_c0_g1~~TRINITY_DN33273_c0_g1_i8.p1  ORF type:complete len:422 (+),score=89.50 TRINITY_DN33273_c0_g1_i8:75-1268(+)
MKAAGRRSSGGAAACRVLRCLCCAAVADGLLVPPVLDHDGEAAEHLAAAERRSPTEDASKVGDAAASQVTDAAAAVSASAASSSAASASAATVSAASATAASASGGGQLPDAKAGQELMSSIKATVDPDVRVSMVSCVALICLCCGIQWARCGFWMISVQLCFFLFLHGLSYGSGGVAFHLLEKYEEAGEAWGSSFGSKNCGWMYAWLISVSASGLSAAATLALVLALTGYRFWIGLVAYVVGVSLATHEAVILGVSKDFLSSGASSGLAHIVCLALSILLLLASCARRGFSCGRGAALAGAVMLLLGWLVLGLVPKKMFPASFTRNAVYHTFVAASCLLVSAAVYQQFAEAGPLLKEQRKRAECVGGEAPAAPSKGLGEEMKRASFTGAGPLMARW